MVAREHFNESGLADKKIGTGRFAAPTIPVQQTLEDGLSTADTKVMYSTSNPGLLQNGFANMQSAGTIAPLATSHLSLQRRKTTERAE